MTEYELLARSALATAWVNLRGRGRPGHRFPRRILVVKLDHLGDLLLATPALRALREAHPGVPIDALVLPESRVLLEGSPLVGRVIVYASPRYRRTTPTAPAPPAPPSASATSATPGDRAAVLAELTRHAYDWLVEFRGDEWTAGELLRTISPARRFDRGTVRVRDWWSRRLGRIRGRRPAPPLHEVETNLAVLQGAIPRWPDDPRMEAPPWPHAVVELERAMRDAGLGSARSKPCVVVQLGATWGPRAWRAENFGAVAGALRAAYDCRIVVLGAAQDALLRDRFLAGGGPSDAAFFFGTLSLPAVGELLRGTHLFLGSDGGLAHLAAACGAPSVVLFGPQNPARFRPWGPGVRALHHPVECYPCAQVVCVRPENPCVNLNSVESVVAAAKELWNPGASRRSGAAATP